MWMDMQYSIQKPFFIFTVNNDNYKIDNNEYDLTDKCFFFITLQSDTHYITPLLTFLPDRVAYNGTSLLSISISKSSTNARFKRSIEIFLFFRLVKRISYLRFLELHRNPKMVERKVFLQRQEYLRTIIEFLTNIFLELWLDVCSGFTFSKFAGDNVSFLEDPRQYHFLWSCHLEFIFYIHKLVLRKNHSSSP